MKKFRLPYGISDYLPEECFQKEQLEKTLAGVFYRAGFEKVRTGALEYYDLYEGILKGGDMNRMFKLTDSDGSLLVLRPDITLQIGRMAATKLGAGLQKLYYIENSYEFLPDTLGASARTREFAQIGIEVLGNSGINGDIEAIVLAVESLRACGLEDFLIEIGNVNFFDGIVVESGFNESDAAELKHCVDNKDTLGTEVLLSKVKLADKAAQAIASLNSLYGGIEVLERAEKLADSTLSQSAIERLRTIMSALESIGYGKYVSVDLGLLKGGYYTGLVMRGLSKNLGVSILDGGRYDRLGEAFGVGSEAIGFAIGTKRLLSALNAQNLQPVLPKCDYAYINQNGFSQTEFIKVQALRARGLRVIKLYDTEKSGLIAYCRQHYIQNAMIFSENGNEEFLVE